MNLRWKRLKVRYCRAPQFSCSRIMGAGRNHEPILPDPSRAMPRIEDYDYFLPPELVAQYPLGERDASRLLVLRRDGGEIRHAGFRDLPAALDENDVLVVNDTRVFPARLLGRKDSGGKVELLLHHLPEAEGNGAVPQAARARATHRGHLKIGQILNFGAELTADGPGPARSRGWRRCASPPPAATRWPRSWPREKSPCRPISTVRPRRVDRETYQTVFAAPAGAVACPTAGLHFTGTVLQDLEARGVEIVRLTLHVGPGTFMPVRHADYTRHRMLPEYFEFSEAAAARLNAAKAAGKRLVAVGTTSVRVLESCASPQGFTGAAGLVRPLSLSRLSIQGGGPLAHQLSPAQVHPAAPGERLRRPGPDLAGL